MQFFVVLETESSFLPHYVNEATLHPFSSTWSARARNQQFPSPLVGGLGDRANQLAFSRAEAFLGVLLDFLLVRDWSVVVVLI